MSKDLLSVIEQQHKALKLCRYWLIHELGFTGSHPIVFDVSSAIAAGKQALEQTRGESKEIAAFARGFYCAAEWAKRPDLYTDIGSPAYIKDVELYLGIKHPQATEPAPSTEEDNPHNVERPNEVADYGHDNSVSAAYQTPYYCAKCEEHVGDTDLPKNVPLRKYAVCYKCQDTTNSQATEPAPINKKS